MKNIYQDDFSADTSRDIYSHSPKERQKDDFSVQGNRPTAERPVRSAKQAPPPIKKSVISNKSAPDGAVPPAGYMQPGFYPQPVFYQPDPSQPYPVYYPPVPGQPFMPAPAYPHPSQSSTAYPPQNTPNNTGNNEAGTRVLFQSADFDKKEDNYDDTHSFSQQQSHVSFDLSEINLSSGKRAPASTRSASENFKVDEMEMGTYEFNIMTAGQSSVSKNILTPDEESRQMGLTEENYIDELLEEDFDEDEQEEIPEEKEKTLPSKEIIRRCILAVSIVAIIIACGSLINEYRLHIENKKLMSDLSGMIITQAPTEESTTKKDSSSSGKKPSTTVPTTLPLVERPLTVEEQWEALKAENPDITFPEKLQLKYAKLYAQNTDFVGYLYAEGSELDSPIVQGETDEEYVEKNFYGEYTKYACPFVTHINSIEPLDDNTVIFGHHMRDGSIFGTLDQYRTLEGYKKAPIISFDTIYQDYDFKIIATMVTNIDPKDDNGYVFTYYWTNLNNELNHTAYLNQLSQRSLYDTGVDVLPTDKLLTLSTCCKDFEDARLVIVARLVRPGESTEVDTSRAVENKNPRFPQAYYDEKGKENPFANAYQWQIS